MNQVKKSCGIVIAADVPSLESLGELVKNTHSVDGVVGYKVGSGLVLRSGLPSLVGEIRKYTSAMVIYDHQKAGTDIPEMANDFALACRDAGINAAILFPQSGPVTCESFVSALCDQNIITIVGGHMTHQGYMGKGGGYIRDSAPEEMYARAADLGVTEFVVPGNKPNLIRKYVNIIRDSTSNAGIWFPGIGRQGGDIKRATDEMMTFRKYAIVGSSIYKDSDQTGAATQLSIEILSEKG